MKKIVSAEEAGKMIRENCSLMVGGFLRCGTPVKVIEEIIKNKTGNLTLIANDTSYPEHDRGRLIANRLVKKAIVGHIGTNPETGRQMNAGELEVELVPLGTLAERIRCGGAGLGGFLTPTGVGTVVEKGKTVIEQDGRKYLLEKPLRADVALVYAGKADRFGNLFLDGTTRNYNPVMATAAETVIAEVDELCDEPLNPAEITIPGIFIDYIVKSTRINMLSKEQCREIIARRVAKEFAEGDVITLGIGLPTEVANYIPHNMHVIFQSENGLLGVGPHDGAAGDNPKVTNAGGIAVTTKPGAVFFDSPAAFTMIRGGHVNATVLGALQVDEQGNLANWMIPGAFVPGMGGAMDLVVGAKRVIIAMEHTSKGAPRIVEKCTLPLTAANEVDLIVTERGVIEVTPEGLVLKEINPAFSLEEVIASTGARLIIDERLKELSLPEAV